MEQHLHVPTDYRPGWIYCVHDNGTQSNQVKCGKTTQDPIKYCNKTYGRCMGETTIIALCRVFDTTFAEGLLFNLLEKYRLYRRREVFELPNLGLIHEVFQALVDATNNLGKVYPERFFAVLCDPVTDIDFKLAA